uniref:Uncharacterized protein n=1 Tax=Anguilla anguilla TaxID=7936 RepID=A0A0E9SFP4_ANGAN
MLFPHLVQDDDELHRVLEGNSQTSVLFHLQVNTGPLEGCRVGPGE